MRAHVLGLSESNVEVSKAIWEQIATKQEERVCVVALGRVEWAKLNQDLGADSCFLPFNTPIPNVDIASTVPIPLSTVFVFAHAYTRSPDTYYQHILREGELSVLATEPVLQGVAVRDYTQFVLVPTADTESDSHSVSTSDISESIPTSESDALEIDEDFLRGWNSTAHSPLGLTPVPVRAIDEQSVNVSTHDLAKLGMLSGDWAVLGPGESHADRARLVRVYAKDETTRSTIESSPVLLFNTLPPGYTSKPTDSGEPHKLFLRPTSYSSTPPPVPLARSITLARVASKAANDKRLADRVVKALREVLQGVADNQNKRLPLLLKLNDLVAIYIDASEPEEEGYETEEEEGSGDVQKSVPQVELDVEPPRIGSSNDQETRELTPVFLKVVNIDYSPASLANGSSNHSADTSPPDQTTTAIAFGEMGCSINPSSTRVSMVGVEHGLVPCLTSYEEDEEDGDVESVLTPLLRATLLPNAAHYGIALSALVRGARGSGKARSVRRSAEKIGVGVWEINAYSLIADTEAKTEGAVRARFEQAALCAPCVFLIRHIEALVRPGQGGKEPAMAAVLAECIRGLGAAWGATGYPVAVVATTAEPDAIPVGVMACFRHEIVLEAPDERRRLRMLNTIVASQKLPLGPDVELSTVTRETAALHAGDLVHLVRGARDQALKRVLKELSDLKSKPDFDIAIPTARDLALAVIPITARDFESALDGARAAYSESIGAPKIPNVSWDDVGGLAHVKGEILDTIQLPLEHPELFADGMKKRSGILLYGPPGTGKTLLAKAVATSCALNFLSVKGPELLNMYIGESEANVRRVFQRARDARPCVVFFDELDSIAPRRGQAGDSGGVMDRIVSQILAELDGMGAGGSGGEVFVIGATNRPDLLDPALLRPGRFDRMLYLGVSKTHQDQLRILQALTRKFKLDPSLDLAAVAERCPFNYTGADFYALCSDAMLKAMARKAEEIERRVIEINSEPPLAEHSYPMTAQYYLAELATPAEVDVLVNQDDFERALSELVPSVSASELEHYREVQQKFASSTINSVEKEAPEENAGDEEVELPKPDKGKGKAV